MAQRVLERMVKTMEKNTTTTYPAIEKMSNSEYDEVIATLATEEISGQCDEFDADIADPFGIQRFLLKVSNV